MDSSGLISKPDVASDSGENSSLAEDGSTNDTKKLEMGCPNDVDDVGTGDQKESSPADALPVPLEDVEELTGGVDEDEGRRLEFPWDEEARKTRVAPKPIKFKDPLVCIDCHPKLDFVACGTVGGLLSVKRFVVEEKEENESEGAHAEEVFRYKDSKEFMDPSRTVRFSLDGSKIFGGFSSGNLSVLDFERKKLIHRFSSAHEESLYSTCPLTEFLVASGDDDGVVKLWDLRQSKCVMTFEDNSDFISSLANGEADENNARRLLATSGDATLTCFNLRQKKVELKSEDLDRELLSMAPIRNRSKLVTGDDEGNCCIFNWGQWGYFADNFPVKTGDSLDSMVAVADNVVVTAGLSGVINAVHFNPNRHLGRLGQHDHIQSMSLSHDGETLVSGGHDNFLRFWNASHLLEIDSEKLPRKAKPGSAKKQLDPDGKRNAFFHDLEEYDKKDEGEDEEEDDDSDEDDSDEDDDEELEESDDDNEKVSRLCEPILEEEEEEDDNENDEDDDDDSDDDDSPPKKKLAPNNRTVS